MVKGKSATIKDVMFALQYGGERLLRTYSHDSKGKGETAYNLSRTGISVPVKIANEVLSLPDVVPSEDGLFPGHTQQYEWRS